MTSERDIPWDFDFMVAVMGKLEEYGFNPKADETRHLASGIHEMHRDRIRLRAETPTGDESAMALRDARVKAGRSLRETADFLGLSYVRYGEIERGVARFAPTETPSLNLPEHKCETIADFGRFMNEMGQEHAGEREWKIGRLTEDIEGFPHERWCFHIRTPLKPEIVFGFNEADLNYMVATMWAALGYHTSQRWVEEIGGSAMNAAGQAPHKSADQPSPEQGEVGPHLT